MNLLPVPVEYVELVWDKVEPLLSKATDASNDRYDTDKIKVDLYNGSKMLWIMVNEEEEIDVALTTSIEDYSGKRAIRVSFAGGKDLLKNIPLARDTIKEFGQSVGCTVLEVLGRRGWDRALKPYGYRLSYVCMEEDI